MSSLDLNYSLLLDQITKNSTINDYEDVRYNLEVQWSYISNDASNLIFILLSAYLILLFLLAFGCGWLVYSVKNHTELDVEKGDKKSFIFADFTEKCDQACIQIV